MTLHEQRAKYERWWLFKKCRRMYSGDKFRLVTNIKAYGPPSGFNVVLEVTFEDGRTITVGPGVKGFRPRKDAMEVEQEKA